MSPDSCDERERERERESEDDFLLVKLELFAFVVALQGANGGFLEERPRGWRESKAKRGILCFFRCVLILFRRRQTCVWCCVKYIFCYAKRDSFNSNY